jgi:hypothetical protein
MKYYYLVYQYTDYDMIKTIVTDVTDIHPFKYIVEIKNLWNLFDYILLNYKEITKDEYDLYLKLNKD